MKEISLTKGMVALVDEEDFERINQYKWCASNESRGKKWYAIRWVKWGDRRMKVRMHREVLGLSPGLICDKGLVVDHKNHDPLDNRKANLEIISQEENMHRSAGWKGSRAFFVNF